MMARLMGLSVVSPRELRALIERESVTTIDVNSRQSWAAAHVPGARHLDPNEYTDADLPSDREAMLVFYCSNPFCRKAPTAAQRARRMGYRNVRVMSAGINGWRDAELPTEAGQLPRP
jgi:rhodanese-related sulfurtransferase